MNRNYHQIKLVKESKELIDNIPNLDYQTREILYWMTSEITLFHFVNRKEYFKFQTFETSDIFNIKDLSHYLLEYDIVDTLMEESFLFKLKTSSRDTVEVLLTQPNVVEHISNINRYHIDFANDLYDYVEQLELAKNAMFLFPSSTYILNEGKNLLNKITPDGKILTNRDRGWKANEEAFAYLYEDIYNYQYLTESVLNKPRMRYRELYTTIGCIAPWIRDIIKTDAWHNPTRTLEEDYSKITNEYIQLYTPIVF